MTCNEGLAGAVIGGHRIFLMDLDNYGNKFVGQGDYRNEHGAGVVHEVPRKPRFPGNESDLAKPPRRPDVSPGMADVAFEIKQYSV
jgi:hypothetical protein